jgi:hypothetical protein
VQVRPALAVLVAVSFIASQAHGLRAAEIVVQDAPAGARVYVDGKYVGDTPLNVPVPCDEVADRRYRIEHPTCGVQEGILNARVRGGAITGMVFTFGILAIFLCPRYFVPVHVRYSSGPCANLGLTREGEVLPPAQPLGQSQPAPPAGGDLAVRLRVLRDLHERGVLTDAEYDRERENALDGL